MNISKIRKILMICKLISIRTAVLFTAVFLLGALQSGCVTKRHIDEVKAEIRDVQLQNSSTQEMISRMDSLLTLDVEENKKMRTDISFTFDEINQQIASLLENYADLLEKLDRIDKGGNTFRVLSNSPGAQKDDSNAADSPAVSENSVESLPAFNCDSTYDEAFLMVWRSEYRDAIEKLNEYLSKCPDHKSAGDAHYWIGECYYSLEKFSEAIDKFLVLFNSYKNNPKLSSALYKLGRSYQETGKKDDAKNAYKKIIDEFPETLEAKQAKERLKDLS